MKEGDVVLTPLLQAGGRTKNRPVVVLRVMPLHADLLVCGVSTRLRQEVSGFDEVVQQQDADYSTSGLKAPSLIRLGFLGVLPAASFSGAIGSIGPERHRRLLERLAKNLVNEPEAQ